MYYNEPYVGRYYEITPSANSTLPAQLKLYFSPAEFLAYNALPLVGGADYPAILPDGSNLRISVYHGLPASGTTGPTGTYNATDSNLLQPSNAVWNAAGGWWEVTVSSPFGFSAFFANTNTNTPLPVVLGDISAVNMGKENRVNWETRTEHAGDYFEVERSKDGKHFEQIGSVTAKGAALCHNTGLPIANLSQGSIITA